MTKFIEIIVDGKPEIINTEVIELIHVHEGRTILRYSKNSAANLITSTIDNTYDEMKAKLL